MGRYGYPLHIDFAHYLSGHFFTRKNKTMEANLTQQDIGRSVSWSTNMFPGQQKEVGVITSFNANYVFVRFGSDTHSKACRYQNLEFEHTVLKTYSCHFTRIGNKGQEWFDSLVVGQKVGTLNAFLNRTYKNCEILAKDIQDGALRFSYD